jgi:hypothetical protein
MSWNLEVDIDLSGQFLDFLESVFNFFSSDIRNVKLIVNRGGWPFGQDLIEQDIGWSSTTLDQISALIDNYSRTDTRTYIGIGLLGCNNFDFSPYPEIYFYGSEDFINRESSCEITFDLGNHKVYQGRNQLPNSERFLDTSFVQKVLEHVCYEVQPRNLYLINEQRANIPWNHHFVFHNSPEGYAQDLCDLIQLGLHGGDERYTDSRRNYQASVSPSQKMMFGRRDPDHIETLQKFLFTYGTQLERKGLPTTFTREYLEESVLDACSIAEEGDPLMDFFFVGEGLGVYAQPLLNRYCESIFLSLISGLTDKEEDLAFAMN